MLGIEHRTSVIGYQLSVIGCRLSEFSQSYSKLAERLYLVSCIMYYAENTSRK